MSGKEFEAGEHDIDKLLYKIRSGDMLTDQVDLFFTEDELQTIRKYDRLADKMFAEVEDLFHYEIPMEVIDWVYDEVENQLPEATELTDRWNSIRVALSARSVNDDHF